MHLKKLHSARAFGLLVTFALACCTPFGIRSPLIQREPRVLDLALVDWVSLDPCQLLCDLVEACGYIGACPCTYLEVHDVPPLRVLLRFFCSYLPLLCQVRLVSSQDQQDVVIP